MFTVIAISAFVGCVCLSTLPDAHSNGGKQKSYNECFSHSEPTKFSKEWVRNNLPTSLFDNWECEDIAYELQDNWYRDDVEKVMRRGCTFTEAIFEMRKQR